ncbi:MAG: YoaK family protein, partial [Actinomycetota bacterium]|nr:YoaK family protein [Actinomycetota bacterium]
MELRTTPGFYLLTAICGIVDAVCFLALGGVFAEIMTGNLMFAAFALGQGRFAVDFVQFAIPLACFTVGAVVGGYVLRNPRFASRRRVGFAWTAGLVIVATVLALVWEPSGTSAQARIVVGVLAVAMGL